ncbi:hypothetical protein CcrC1_gp382 [Caulobacter phage C1]|nr:hypothetical protein CcrC1_gp382 [Caulobacter phage C1]UTU08611.1 hypothetical protein CcrC2_gp383 [Caulobacter phage C2]UTU10244.1 hypothetical protein CcrRB23_gp382 [Caulobacter phage RB23]WGN97278.1 hypothetical protein [Bertelyvirus sp.]WGN97796.1 hypothetical protein [Bertelyvirus sp.]
MVRHLWCSMFHWLRWELLDAQDKTNRRWRCTECGEHHHVED